MRQRLAVLAVPIEGISHLFHDPVKVTHRCGGQNCPVNVGFHHARISGFAVLFSRPFQIVLFLALRIFDDGQIVLLAKPVRYLPHPSVRFLAVVILIAIVEGYGIYNEMIMIVICVEMRCNNHFKPITP